jgi:hypothetical protein
MRRIGLFLASVSDFGDFHSALRIRHFEIEFIPHSPFFPHSEKGASCF